MADDAKCSSPFTRKLRDIMNVRKLLLIGLFVSLGVVQSSCFATGNGSRRRRRPTTPPRSQQAAFADNNETVSRESLCRDCYNACGKAFAGKRARRSRCHSRTLNCCSVACLFAGLGATTYAGYLAAAGLIDCARSLIAYVVMGQIREAYAMDEVEELFGGEYE